MAVAVETCISKLGSWRGAPQPSTVIAGLMHLNVRVETQVLYMRPLVLWSCQCAFSVKLTIFWEEANEWDIQKLHYRAAEGCGHQGQTQQKAIKELANITKTPNGGLADN